MFEISSAIYAHFCTKVDYEIYAWLFTQIKHTSKEFFLEKKMLNALLEKDDFGIIKCTFYLHQNAIFMHRNMKSKKFNGFLITHEGNLKQVWFAILTQIALPLMNMHKI